MKTRKLRLGSPKWERVVVPVVAVLSVILVFFADTEEAQTLVISEVCPHNFDLLVDCSGNWSISVGIICGAGLTALAAVLSVIVSVVIWLFNALPAAKPPVLLMMTTRNIGTESAVLEIVNKYCKWAKVKSRTMTSDQLDLVIEIRGAEECALAPALMALDGVTSATILEHDGDVTM